MATLYDKLHAQDGEDHMAWLAEVTAEFDKEDKPDLFVPAVPSPPSVISSGSSSASSSPQNSITSLDSNDQSEGDSDSDSDSDSEIELIDNPDGILFQCYDPIQYNPSNFLDHNLHSVADLPYVPPVELEYHPLLNFECDPMPQAALTMEPTPPSSFVPQPTSEPVFPTVNNSLPFMTRSTRSFLKPNVPVAPHDLEEDADGQSDANETDDEYVPSSSRNPKKRRRSTRHSSVSAHVPTYITTQYVSPAAKRPRSAPLPRNAQAVPGIIPSFANKSNPWACPYCKWVQRNHRTPDLKRHIRTHTRFERPAQWVCCGIPAESAAMYNVPHNAAPYIHNGKQMIGGCGKEFSRRDALKRHLGNDHISCVGDIDAFANVYED